MRHDEEDLHAWKSGMIRLTVPVCIMPRASGFARYTPRDEGLSVGERPGLDVCCNLFDAVVEIGSPLGGLHNPELECIARLRVEGQPDIVNDVFLRRVMRQRVRG